MNSEFLIKQLENNEHCRGPHLARIELQKRMLKTNRGNPLLYFFVVWECPQLFKTIRIVRPATSTGDGRAAVYGDIRITMYVQVRKPNPQIIIQDLLELYHSRFSM